MSNVHGKRYILVPSTNVFSTDTSHFFNFHESSLTHCLVMLWYSIFQTILVGDSGVGKTSLLVQFDQGKFQPGSFSATVGIGFTVSSCVYMGRYTLGLCMSQWYGNEAFLNYSWISPILNTILKFQSDDMNIYFPRCFASDMFLCAQDPSQDLCKYCAYDSLKNDSG